MPTVFPQYNVHQNIISKHKLNHTKRGISVHIDTQEQTINRASVFYLKILEYLASSWGRQNPSLGYMIDDEPLQSFGQIEQVAN